GPGAYCTQFAMERTIGDLGQEVKQPSNPYANLAQRALRRAQVNALKSIYPEIDTDDAGYKLPQGAKDMGEGLVVLRPRSSKLHWGTGREQFLLQGQFGNNPVCQWGRLRLPNGQIARSRFCEVDLFRKRKPRHTRNVQLWYSGEKEYGEVWYYFINDGRSHEGDDPESDHSDSGLIGYAMVSLYSRPDPVLLRDSYDALWACEYLGADNLHIVRIKDIRSVVSMQPLPALPDEPEGQWFVVQKPGIDEPILTGHEEDMAAV
ncbi:hypothetical protein GGU11DRAFT_694253, partial [Lentinula aff. detonsa]